MAVKLHWEDRKTQKVTHECVVEGFEEPENGRRRWFYRRVCEHNQKKGVNPVCLGCIVASGNTKLPNLFKTKSEAKPCPEK